MSESVISSSLLPENGSLIYLTVIQTRLIVSGLYTHNMIIFISNVKKYLYKLLLKERALVGRKNLAPPCHHTKISDNGLIAGN